MITSSASIISPPQKTSGAASLAEKLFQSVGYMTTIVPDGGSRVECKHCHRKIFSVIGDCLVVEERHDKQYHTSVVSLGELGLMRIPGQELL